MHSKVHCAHGKHIWHRTGDWCLIQDTDIYRTIDTVGEYAVHVCTECAIKAWVRKGDE